MIHFHLIYLVPAVIIPTLAAISWLHGVDAEDLTIRGVYETIGLVFGWYLRGSV